MRIAAGRFRGRALATPDGDAIRPTSDRVREAAFNILAHGYEGLDLAGCRVLDLFAGTGALGLEAISRGAAFCLFVEEDIAARALIRRNIETFGLTGQTRIYRRDATRLGPALPRERFGLVFADPPYGKGLGERALATAAEGGWLEPGAIVVLEERADVTVVWPEGFEPLDRRIWRDTAMHFARWRGDQHEAEAADAGAEPR